MDDQLATIIKYLNNFKVDQYQNYNPITIDGKLLMTTPLSESINDIYVPLPEVEKQSDKIKLIFKDNNEINNDEYNTYIQKDHLLPSDILKPWNKISINIKIKLIFNYVDSLIPKLSPDKKNELIYLLVGAITTKQLNKQSSVNYDSKIGKIINIPKLEYNNCKYEL
jgi:hypothetical protein